MTKGMPTRFVTAASLFDGHDVSINIMRRILQDHGVEVIHLGHNRSAHDVVRAAICEDADGVAISSYQGGHNYYFPYVRELLDQQGASAVKIFGGGGGVITPREIEVLEKKGVEKIYSPQDGMELGLEGIIKDMIHRAQRVTTREVKLTESLCDYQRAQIISEIENGGGVTLPSSLKSTPVLGITGTGGAGKSSLIDEILLRFHRSTASKIALISVDPTRKRTQGALLGDRIRLGCGGFERFFIRSLATRDSRNELSPQIKKVVNFLKTQEFDLIIIETSGIGQASDAITEIADHCLYVMTPEYGAQSQLEKIEMLEAADFIAVNKYERPQAEDALRDVRKQYRRNKKFFSPEKEDHELPVFGTIASQFNDEGVNALFVEIAERCQIKINEDVIGTQVKASQIRSLVIPPERRNYLAEIAHTCRSYNEETRKNSDILRKLDAFEVLQDDISSEEQRAKLLNALPQEVFSQIEKFKSQRQQYQTGSFSYKTSRGSFEVATQYTSLSQQKISRVGYPRYSHLDDIYRFVRSQNLPGFFPYATGIFPFKRQDEEAKRMFAGEGGPSRTNERFHFLCSGEKFHRLSTAFDSVTLYGEDPDHRPDIFGKVGESGVSIATLQDMGDLFRGFDLTSNYTSVSKTINGPAPMILAMFMNTAVKQQLGAGNHSLAQKVEIMRRVRGTVQADILKEDQAQNTCIFSLDFALKLMGDVQEFFSKHQIKNYYTVSISGYHIAEAGANPITQLALTLANGFTYVEYYLARGIPIDDFCENLSFFFSNGLDPEYTVLGRVARKIWAVTLRDLYGANSKSQKLKYHIQTSGRSLHAQEMAFNDIRTTLQAFLAISDSCNSLHTNAYDEAVTTPTQESVRRAMAIQKIINQEYGLNKTDNPLQGSFIYDELAEIVEEAVMAEFENISKRGGVLGAMETMYQRSKIQEESLYYERLKDSGDLPIIGVNTYIAPDIDEKMHHEVELTRASDAEKEKQIERLENFKRDRQETGPKALERLQKVVIEGGNIFEELLYTTEHCSLGEITQLLYQVGGAYRRNM